MDQEDKERLVKIEVNVGWLKTAFATHLSEHTRVRLLVMGSAIAAVAAILISLM